MSVVHIFFGEMGSGKSFQAKRFAQHEFMPRLEGDDLCSAEMVDLVSQFKPLSYSLVAELVDRLIMRMGELCETDDALVVSQALYFNDDRLRVSRELEALGHSVVWHWVRPGFFTNMKRLFGRPRGLRWIAYWLLNKPFFDRPTHYVYQTIVA